MEEVWKDAIGYEGIYKISNKGNVLICRRLIHLNGGQFYCKSALKKCYVDKAGYVRASLWKENVRVLWTCHRMVALAFLTPVENKLHVNHIDGNKQNNYVENLEWCTSSENRYHAFRLGLVSAVGVKNGACKLTEEQVLKIRQIHIENPETPLRKTSAAFGISRSLVSRINLKQSWSHL